jgi:hypothetical protein
MRTESPHESKTDKPTALPLSIWAWLAFNPGAQLEEVVDAMFLRGHGRAQTELHLKSLVSVGLALRVDGRTTYHAAPMRVAPQS